MFEFTCPGYCNSTCNISSVYFSCGAKNLTLSKVVPLVVKLLDDPSVPVGLSVVQIMFSTDDLPICLRFVIDVYSGCCTGFTINLTFYCKDLRSAAQAACPLTSSAPHLLFIQPKHLSDWLIEWLKLVCLGIVPRTLDHLVLQTRQHKWSITSFTDINAPVLIIKS